MPIDVGESINNFADYFLQAPLVSTIAKNPIYTALLVVLIVIIVILWVFRDADTDDALFIMALRSGFWVFLMLVGVLFIHNKVLCAESFAKTKISAYEGVFNGSGYSPGEIAPSLADSIVPVPTMRNHITDLTPILRPNPDDYVPTSAQ